MRLLLCSSLRDADPAIYSRLAARAAGLDLLVLPGGLLDPASSRPRAEQERRALAGLGLLAGTASALAVCSAPEDLGPDGRAPGGWLARWAAGQNPVRIAADGGVLVLPGLVLAVAPWTGAPDGAGEAALWERARGAAAAAGAPAWAVVRHEPPAGSRTGAGAAPGAAADVGAALATRMRPDLLLCAGVPFAPWVRRRGFLTGPRDGGFTAGSWADRLSGGTWVFNPGRRAGEDGPRLVELDLAAGTARWRDLSGRELGRRDLRADGGEGGPGGGEGGGGQGSGGGGDDDSFRAARAGAARAFARLAEESGDDRSDPPRPR